MNKFSCTLAILAYLATTGMNASEDYAFEISCERSNRAYCIHEPIGILFKVKNKSSKSVYLYTESGRDAFSVSFECKNRLIKNRATTLTFFEGFNVDSSAHQIEFKSGESISGVRYVNQDKDFEKEGIFDIEYSFNLNYDYAELKAGKMLAKVEQKGKFDIVIIDRKIKIKDLDPILKRWGSNRQQIDEVMNALALVDDPMVIPLLVKYARSAPSSANIAAIALRKFINQKEGLEALEELGREFGRQETFLLDDSLRPKELGYGQATLSSIFGSLLAMERAPTEKFVKEQLNSPREYRILAMLDFLLRSRQKANSAPLDEVERLQEHKNKEIAEAARKVFEKISKQKVKDDF